MVSEDRVSQVFKDNPIILGNEFPTDKRISQMGAVAHIEHGNWMLGHRVRMVRYQRRGIELLFLVGFVIPAIHLQGYFPAGRQFAWMELERSAEFFPGHGGLLRD